MKEPNFLPLWYRKKVEKRNEIKFKVVIIILISFIGVIGFRLFKDKKSLIDVNNKMEVIKLNTKKQKNIQNNNIKNKLCTINIYTQMKQELFEKFKLDDISIKKDKVLVKKVFDNILDISNLLEYIENNQNYNIKHVDIENLEEDKILLKLDLKVGNYE
ncbi:hypothetical protein Z957_02360 [Clostridium sp. K25]|uniref:Uncharacterized protein n=1 Tax=Clostridium botulinum D str. 1873 TaxID=592027 RepID=A0A9P2G7F3_CLOBO|nr:MULTISPECIES: hypothetical protein [Clostridium]AYF54951.1 hypothetical protein DFH04_09555 [Clostridium novyi]EES91411.1 conserved hypothetical protein [Clostridium botulinum D str. 1873]KEI10594.1 hypothetical protein Z957_02360 [Clostridium sp. K25]MBO3441954.1 hypothetical protein [Clostridium haemolyticum]MCD3215917.1 hypothetical protein [Clostridium botulinum C]